MNRLPTRKLLLNFHYKIAYIIERDIRFKVYLVGDILGQSFNEPNNFKVTILILTKTHLELFKLSSLVLQLEILSAKRCNI